MGLNYIDSVGNFICVDVGPDAMGVYDGLLRAGVIVRPVGNYNMPNHLRITVGTEAENTTFIDALTALLATS